MLREFLYSGDLKSTLLILLLEIPVIVLALSVHEAAHGYIAYRCGDGTAKAFGRLTLNPAKHIDPLGALFMFLFGFGWAKPVPVNTRNLRKPKRDIALVSLAGPVSNLLMAFVFAGIYMLMWRLDYEAAVTGIGLMEFSIIGVTALLSYIGVILNVGLAVFNLIPLPPLDGSNVLLSLLPQRIAVRYVELRKYTGYIYLAIVAISWILPDLFDVLFTPLHWVRDGIVSLMCLPFKLLFTGDSAWLYEFAAQLVG